MKDDINNTRAKHPVRRTILWVIGLFGIILTVGATFLYFNFNRLLSDALRKNFNATLISDVYELKFEKLKVNFLVGNISVLNVDLQPRNRPLNSYPYINSSFHLKAGKILLGNVRISTLLKSNILKLDNIDLTEPEIDFTISDVNPIFFPFNDTALFSEKDKKNIKRSIESFVLKKFNLTDASFHVSNSAKQREFNIQQINIIANNLLLDQRPGKDVFSYKHVALSIGKSTGEMKETDLRYISFKDYKLTIDSLEFQRTKDTLIYHFADFATGLNELKIQTEDSIFHLSVKSIDISYRDKSIITNGINFKPNISDAALQARSRFQHAHFSGTIGTLQMKGIQFDSLIYNHKLFIDQILIDNVSAYIFKDKVKPLDTKRFTEYPGQSIKKISVPLLVKQVNATNVDLLSRERKPDGSFATGNIKRGTAEIKHITNISAGEKLMLKADAYSENKAHFHLNLHFSYLEPQFSFDIRVDEFYLPDINPVLQSFTPAKINKGTLDEMTLSGNAYHKSATGTMKFLYHDLEIDLDLKDEAKWKSSVLAFAANSIMPSANPASGTVPPRTVQFKVERDMHKPFINIIFKSLYAGMKETMVMSKENRKDNREAKIEAKKEAKNDRKRTKN